MAHLNLPRSISNRRMFRQFFASARRAIDGQELKAREYRDRDDALAVQQEATANEMRQEFNDWDDYWNTQPLLPE
jgi:hypothetical protein